MRFGPPMRFGPDQKRIAENYHAFWSRPKCIAHFAMRFDPEPKRMVILGYAKGSTSNGHIRIAALGRAQRSTSNGHIP